MQNSEAVVGANRMVQAPPLLVLAQVPEEPALPQMFWASRRTPVWAPGMKVGRHPTRYLNPGLVTKGGRQGLGGSSCQEQTLIPRPPLDGQLRPRPLSKGRRAVSVHEDQLQAPAGEGDTSMCA
jgi:hypothetical protein